jgi:hypothetical protein
MANVFKNYTGQATTAGTAVYTVPADTTAVVIGMNLANTAISQQNASVQLGSTYVVKDAPIPSGSALSVLDGKIIMESGEVITVTGDNDNYVDVILSVLEQS